MLLELRKVTRGAFATIVLGVIGISMVIFLIPRTGFQSPLAQYVASGGNVQITPAELTRELDVTLRQARNNGQNLSQEEAIDQNVHLRLLDSLIARRALYNYAERLGINASDTQVARRIREIPAVLNPVTRAFDPNAYDAFLSDIHYTRPDFEREIRADTTTQMLMEALVAGARPPSSYGALAVVYNSESRIVSVASASSSVVGSPPTPTEAQLQTFYQENREALRVPEYRSLTLVYARDSDFASHVTVTDAQIEPEFQQRQASLTQPEKRSSVRIAAQSEQQANTIAARLAHGESADTVAHSLGLQAVHGADETRDAVSDANVAAAVFAMTPNTPPRVVHGALAPFVVVQVQSVTPAVTANAAALANLRNQIRQQLALDQARELKDAATNAFDEARGGGATAADAARRAGLQVVSIPAADAQGRDANGQPIPALSGERNELLRTANQTAEGEASDFIPVGDADVVVSVEHVTPPSIRPYAQVRDQLARAWAGRELSRRMQEFADTVIHDVQSGRPFDSAAAAHRMSMAVRSQPITREQAGRLPAQRLGAEIFAANEGDVVSDVRADGGAVLIAQIEHIRRIDPAQATQQVAQMRAQAAQQMVSQMGEAIQGQVVADAHVQRNDAVIRNHFRGSRDAQAGGGAQGGGNDPSQ